MIAGASHIDHADMLRAGATAGVLGHRVMAPSTLGTFLRAFTFGHVRQLEAVIGRALERAWGLGAGPGTAPLVIDVDSTICEVDGKHKQGAGYGYTHVLGYHPILATRADSGEVLHARMRKGQANTQRGARRFIDELIARVRRAGASGEITIRMDSGFWSNDTIVTLGRLDVRYTMAVRTSTKGVSAAIARIPENAWTTIDYSADGEAQVAECAYTTGTGRRRTTRRLIVRRTRLTDTVQQRLWPDWRHHAFLTDIDGDAVDVDRFHRHHAVIELAIRDLKDGAGLGHVPSGHFHANSAWLQCVVLAHNLIRWTATLGDVRVDRRTDRRPHHPHSPHRPPRPTRQPRRSTNPAPSRPLAVGGHVHHRPHHAPPAATRPHLNAPSRSGRRTHTASADNPDTRTAHPARTQPRSRHRDDQTPSNTAEQTPLTGHIGGSRLRTRG